MVSNPRLFNIQDVCEVESTCAFWWNMIDYMISSQAGVENKEDIQHLDHEIKELNDSNMKIEADMMQLQTQVNTYSDHLMLHSSEIAAHII